MNHPLTQSGEKLGRIDGSVAAGDLAAATGMQKDQVQVGAVAQLQSAQFPIGNNGKSTFKRCFFKIAYRQAMPGDQVFPGEIHHVCENDFSDIGQPIAHIHQGQLAGDIGGGDP